MTAPSREQIAKWAQEAGFTVRNDIIKVAHSNGSWVELSERLALFAIQAYTEGMVAQAKRQPPPMVVDDPDVVALVAAAVQTERESCARMLDQLEQQRDELLVVLERIASTEIAHKADALWDALCMRHAAKDAVAKVKGGAT